MRLTNTESLELEEFVGDQIPPYAILSHTWGPEEVSFQEWNKPERPNGKAGYRKIMGACLEARNQHLDYLWCDTNCIDKSSSAELSEAINSMFPWYRDSAICFAILEDVSAQDEDISTSMKNSRWFTRGWTLQELLAPKKLQVYDQNWELLGSREQLKYLISRITGIPKEYLLGNSLSTANIAQKTSWLAKRQTTRIEDMAYCMFGIFDVNLPLLYGEGPKAFLRLQEELIRVSNDHTIFCWQWLYNAVPADWNSMLAPTPAVFADSGDFSSYDDTDPTISAYAITNAGLAIKLGSIQASSFEFALLSSHMGPAA
ncbi:HET-domain-containing protein [Xylariaceae sp. FL0016]|nr:HET-domain-containing protein [Xylariaceae sp. FL0016]